MKDHNIVRRLTAADAEPQAIALDGALLPKVHMWCDLENGGSACATRSAAPAAR
ncbi:hypothetical protein M2282_004133 [Variovorax boronicumulans]|uniref:hypothetical protein n=1 Tax=Variovorax boronicumulans TaxID=436515 RepID=UPI0024757ED3|nr:hypothetical protein [Variovorax boronicumulans]MDH6168969.1 hypothetical protein [Variovorax boronicumulans]